MTGKRITVGLPTNRGFLPETMQCLLELIKHSSKKHDFNIIVSSEGYTIAENRNYIATRAVNDKSDYLLFIDDDMTFKPDLLDILLANEKEICGVAYHSRGSETITKCVETEIMAISEIEKDKYIDLEKNDDPKYKKTFECYAAGTGIMLIKCDVFHKIPQPWFEFSYHDNGKCKEGEDWFFCIKAKKYNIKTYSDPTPKIGHIGECVY